MHRIVSEIIWQVLARTWPRAQNSFLNTAGVGQDLAMFTGGTCRVLWSSICEGGSAGRPTAWTGDNKNKGLGIEEWI